MIQTHLYLAVPIGKFSSTSTKARMKQAIATRREWYWYCRTCGKRMTDEEAKSHWLHSSGSGIKFCAPCFNEYLGLMGGG